MAGLEKKRFSEPDERVLFPGIVEELLEIGGFTLGKTTHDPGWRHSTDMGALVGAALRQAGSGPVHPFAQAKASS